MAEIEKSVLGSVRLDSDVWEAVRKMPVSLNQYLRRALLEMPDALGAKFEQIKKKSRKAIHAEELKASDPMGAERDDIEFGNTEVPSGGSVALVGAAIPVSKSVARPHSFHSGTRPIAGCPVCAAMAKEQK
jgi:hypothetical protein